MEKLIKAVSLSIALMLGIGFSSSTLASIVVSGNDNGLVTSPVLTAPSASTLTFDWLYTSFDVDGATWDPAGYYLDASFFQLTNDAGSSSQSGTVSFAVASGQTYGFYVSSVDNFGGGATIQATQATQVTQVPEPGTLALLGLGLFGLVAAKRRKQA